jgi:hypothetical protein
MVAVYSSLRFEDLLLDAVSGLLRLPLLILVDKGEVGAHIQRRPLLSRLDRHLREGACELEGAPLGLVVVGDDVLLAKDPLRCICDTSPMYP